MGNAHCLAFCIAMSLALGACAQPAASGSAAATRPTAPPTPVNLTGVRIDTIASGLDHPWAVALLPEGGFLVTERSGQLRRISAGGKVSAPIGGVPAVFAEGQGGLLDVVLAPDFASSRRIYLSFAEAGPGGTAGTAVASATLDKSALQDVRVIYRQAPKLSGSAHFGSRLAFDALGHIFISQGERNERALSQELDKLQGKLVRLGLDGSIPRDNPFMGRKEARPEIWSYGHRNAQGMAFDPRTGTLWQSEHGPRGGDELNLPGPGRNYGWPVITHGINYSGLKIPEAVGNAQAGMEQPHHVWAKSPGLSGMAFLTGKPGHPWNDSLFLGALAERNLIRLQLDGERIVGEERLLVDLGERIRDVRVGNDGAVYVLTDADDGRLLRLVAPGDAGKR